MTLPGVVVETANTAPTRSVPTDTGTAFLAGIFSSGPVTPVTPQNVIRSMADLVAVYGARVNYSVAHDWAETYFREGGNRLYVSRVVGPSASLPGSDDHANITQAQVTAALGRFGADLGPGQVVSPDWQTSAAHLALAAHATANNRVALADFADTTNPATLLTAAAALKGTVNASRLIAVAPWLNIPSIAPGGSGRAVPASALYAAKAAQTDARVSANQAPAGEYGAAQFVASPRATFDRTPGGDAEDLNDAGVNLVVDRYGVRVYGNRTQVDPAGAEATLLQASNARYRMSLAARGGRLLEPYVHRRITPSTLSTAQNAISGLLLGDYTNGDLFGDIEDDRPETAFNVDVSAVNTPESIAAGELNVAAAYRAAPGGELVNLTITATAVTQPVA